MRTARPSRASLLLTPRFDESRLAAATGFLVEFPPDLYLVTNWHVVTGRHPETGQALDPVTGAVPNMIDIAHNIAEDTPAWAVVTEQLYDENDDPLWLEHGPIDGRRVDVVALRLTQGLDSVVSFPHDPFAEPLMQVAVADQVSIVGFPFGLTAGGSFGVWTQGTVASEPEVDFDDLPLFLVDSRTRTGMSGSPVIAYSSGGLRRNKDGSATLGGPPVEMFLGVYAGRVNPDSDLGRVWKATVVAEILDAGRRASRP